MWFFQLSTAHLPSAAGGGVLLQEDPPWHQQLESVAAEDAVHEAEDGDCLEAAEEPPELIPGEGEETHTLRAHRRPRLKQRQ